MIKSIHSILFFSTLLIGIALRAQETISQNFIFLIDQGRDMMAVKSIIYNHHLTLIGPYTSLQGVFQGPLWYYLLAIPTLIAGGNPWGAVVLMLIVSVSVLVVVYFWMSYLFGKQAGLFTAFVFAISPEAVAAATYSWNPHPMWLLITIYIFSFYSLIKKTNFYHLLVWPTLGLMFHFQTALAVFLLIASLIYVVFFKRKFLQSKNFFYGMFLMFTLFLPQIIFDLRHDFLMSSSVLRLLSGSDQGLFVRGENTHYFTLVKNHIDAFYYNFTTAFVREGLLQFLPSVALIMSICMILFQRKLKLIQKSEYDFILFLLSIICISFVLSLFYPFPIRYWFLTGFQSFFLIIFGLLLSSFWKMRLGKVSVSLLILIIGFYTVDRIDSLYFHPANDGGVAKVKGKLEAIDYLYKDANEEKFNLLVFTPPVNTDAYDYLLFWRGRNRYGFIPEKRKGDEFYLLIEPDPEKPWSYDGWIKTVVKTGKVISSRKLPSGFIIQKRVEEDANDL